MLLGIGIVLLFEHLDNTFKTPDDVKAQLGLPFLGMVPEVDVKGAVSQLLDSYEQDFRRALTAQKIAFNDVGAVALNADRAQRVHRFRAVAQRALALAPGEVALVFPAPVSRATLLGARLLAAIQARPDTTKFCEDRRRIPTGCRSLQLDEGILKPPHTRVAAPKNQSPLVILRLGA